MKKAIICDNNYLTSGDIDIRIKGSDDPVFSKDNLYDNSRSVLFKFPVVFVFDSTNNTIETSGDNFIITEGEYTPSELNTELANGNGNQWNSFSYDTSTRTFTVDPIEIIRRSSSAIDHFNFPGSSDISSQTEGNPISSYPYTFVDFDLKLDHIIEFLSIIGDITSQIDIDPSSVISVEGNLTGGYGQGQWSETLEYDKKIIYKNIKEKELEARYLRLKIESPPSIKSPTIGLFYAGEAREMPDNRNFGNEFVLDFVNLTETKQTERNQFIFNSRPYKRELSSLGVPTANKKLANFLKDAFLNSGVESPFFISLDPNGEIHEDPREVTFFARFSEPPSVSHIINQYYDFSFSIQEVF